MTVNTTAPTDEVDTSTNEETPDTEAELENDTTSFDDAEDDSEGEETEESSESEEGESANESTEEEPEESEEDANDEEPAEAQESEKDSKAEQKRHNDEMAKRRIAEREAREQAKRDAQAQYVNEATDPHEIALRQLQVDAYNNRILTNANVLQNGLDKAVAHIDLFKSKDPVLQEALLQAMDDFEAMHVQKDRNGDPIHVSGDLFDFLQRKAESIRRLTSVGARQQQVDKSKTKARTTTLPGRVPKQPKKDPDLEAFDEEADRW